ncbi:MAG: DUF3592 domain-containing protein [Chloroflexota bacterium]|mgnify:CR=1 FL=1
MEQYEKNFDKAANTAANAMDKVNRGANKLYIGCALVFGNLFFMAFCLWGVYAAVVAYRLETSGVVTEGTVVRLEESADANGGCCTYSPVIEFSVNGQTYTFEGGTASNPPAYQIGERVKVLYDPTDPNTAQINKYSERWFFPICIIPSMIFASLLLTFFMVRAWRRGEDVLTDML